MKIFITGGDGFIGKHLVNKIRKKEEILLLSQYQKDTKNIIHGDLSNIIQWEDKIKNFNPDTTIHLAWESLPLYDYKTSRRNLEYGLNLIEMLCRIGCKKIICSGSCWEYGKNNGKLNEDMPLVTSSINAFSAAKKSLQLLGREIANENNINFIWTRLFYVYGPGQRRKSLIPYIIDSIKSNKKPDIKNPLAKNDFVYVEDVAEAIFSLAKKCSKNEIYNIGSGYSTSVQEIMRIVYDNYDTGNSYEYKEEKNKESSINFWADISKIKKDTGWKPKTDIKKGIEEMIKYYGSIS